MNALTYWDLTEVERAALTREDVEKFLDFELMSKGVLKVKPLVLVPVPEVKLETARFYVVQESAYEYPSIAFRTEDDARAFLALQAVKVERDFGTESSWAKSSAATEIKSVELATEDSVTAAKARLREAAAAKSENERRREAHHAQARKTEEALRGLWEDWHECTAKDAQMRRIDETFTEYVTMTKDHAMASAFLRKVFDASEITEAEKWTGKQMTFAGEAAAE